VAGPDVSECVRNAGVLIGPADGHLITALPIETSHCTRSGTSSQLTSSRQELKETATAIELTKKYIIFAFFEAPVARSVLSERRLQEGREISPLGLAKPLDTVVFYPSSDRKPDNLITFARIAIVNSFVSNFLSRTLT
jgi:hypothetical protein